MLQRKPVLGSYTLCGISGNWRGSGSRLLNHLAPLVGAVLVLGFGDPVASFVGSRWGKYRLANDKSLIGCLSFFTVSLLASLLYLVLATSLPWSQVALIAGCIALVGALVELFSHKFDDNFTIPVACALTALIWF